MLLPTILFAIQVVITQGPPGPTVVLPGGAGVGVSSPGSMSPAGNEVAQAGQLRLSNGYVMVFRQRSAPARGGFFVRNDSDLADRLVAVSTPMADRVTMWRTDLTAGGPGEVEQPSVEIAPRSDFTAGGAPLDPNRGRLQLKFEGLRLPENPSDGVPVTLVFERAGPVTVRAFPMIPRE
jgi:copper(I)-binding protein